MSTREFAGRLVREIVAIKSFSLWRDSHFRELTRFPKLVNKEQDKIFNDLEVAALLYVLMFLEEKASKDGNLNMIYTNIGEYIIEAFLDLMGEAGLTQKQIKLWRELIEIRELEYKKQMGLIMKETDEWGVFDSGDKLLRETWGRVVTLSLGIMEHIKQGKKAATDDPLWIVIRKWLIGLEVELAQTFKETDFGDLQVLN
jgi:hypothetical protein